MVAFALVLGNALLGVLLCSAKLPREAERTPAEMMRLDQEIVVAHFLS
jgi:hypothetical protein